MNSDGQVVRLERNQAMTLVASARWVHHLIRNGELGVNPDEQQLALAELREAIDAATAQLEGAPRPTGSALRKRTAPWWGYGAAVLAVCAATFVIEACYLLGLPRTVVGLYIPVALGVALVIGLWPSLLGCVLAFLLNDSIFVHPGRFSPAPEQVAALGVVALTCAALRWLMQRRAPAATVLRPTTSPLACM